MIWTSPSPTFNFVFWNERAEVIFAYCISHILFCKLLSVSLIDYEFWLKWQCSKSNIAYKRKNTKNAFSSVLQSKRKNKLLLSLLRNFVQTSHFMGSSHCYQRSSHYEEALGAFDMNMGNVHWLTLKYPVNAIYSIFVLTSVSIE